MMPPPTPLTIDSCRSTTWSLAGVFILLVTMANLVPRALATHRWYQKQFEDYPQNRKALVPYLI